MWLFDYIAEYVSLEFTRFSVLLFRKMYEFRVRRFSVLIFLNSDRHTLLFNLFGVNFSCFELSGFPAGDFALEFQPLKVAGKRLTAV